MLVVELSDDEFGIEIKPCEAEPSVMVSFRHSVITDIYEIFGKGAEVGPSDVRWKESCLIASDLEV